MKNFLYRIAAAAALLSCIFTVSCDEPDTPPATPDLPEVKIGTITPGKESAVVEVTLSKNATSFSWAVIVKATALTDKDYTKVTDFEADADGKVTIEVTAAVGENTFYIFAENKDGKSAVARQDFTIEEEPVPTVSIVSVAPGEKSAVATLKISDAESYSWACVAKDAEVKDGDYTKVTEIVKGDDGFVKLELTELEAGEYDLYIFAENANGKSEAVKKGFVIEAASDLPTAEIHSVTTSPKHFTAQITVSEDITSLSWACVAKGTEVTDGNYTKIESPTINMLGRVSITVEELTVDTEYDFYVFVESAAGKSAVVSQTVKTPAQLVSYELKNITAVSLDLAVEMLGNCKAYCATILRTEVYNEKNFTESGKTSLDETAYYRPYEAHTESAVLDNESMGDIILLRESEGEAVEYIAAIYAVDNDGNGQVITSDPFTLPVAEFGKSDAAVTIELDPANTSVNVSYTPNSSTAKVIFNYTASMTSLEDDAEIKKHLGEQIYGLMPEKHTTPWSKEFTALSPGGVYFFYALAIDAEGKFGDIVYVKGGPKEYTQDGKGTVTATLKEATQTSLSYNVKFENGTTKARFVAVDPTSMALFYKDEKTIFNTLCDDNMSPMWSEYTQEDLDTAKGVISFDCPYEGSDYTLYAVTYDAEGKSSVLFNLGTEKTKAIEFEYGGIGEASIEIVSVTEDEYEARNVTYKIVYGANTTAAYLFTAGWGESIDPQPFNPAEEGTAITNETVRKFTLLDAEDYYTVAVVTQDADGKFKKAVEKKYLYNDLPPTE